MSPSEPWQPTDRVRLVGAQLACIAAVIIAAMAASGREAVDDQILWLNVGVLGAIGSALVNGLWLLRLRRATGERRRIVLGSFETIGDEPAARAPRDGSDLLVTVAGMALVHRPGCALVAGKPVVPAAPGGEPCGWCHP